MRRAFKCIINTAGTVTGWLQVSRKVREKVTKTNCETDNLKSSQPGNAHNKKSTQQKVLVSKSFGFIWCCCLEHGWTSLTLVVHSVVTPPPSPPQLTCVQYELHRFRNVDVLRMKRTNVAHDRTKQDAEAICSLQAGKVVETASDQTKACL